MSRTRWALPRVLLTAPALLAALLAACQGPPLVDRTRPDYVRKADLTSGTWYVMDTVVGVPSTSSIAFEGMQGKLEKVRLEVQEGHLVAFRAYEYLPGSDPRVDPDASAPGGTVGRDGTRFRGAPVYAWPIQSHFDRQRQYNPATGEQSNVLEENTTDRPWHQREFMRVDWGRNAVVNPFTLSGGLPGGDVTYSPHVSPLELAEGEDALTADYRTREDGTRELAYLDFTVRQHWEPQTVDYPGYGPVPACLLDPTEDCTGAEVRVRTSLRRVDEARSRDYEPLHYDDRAMVKFGFFRTERLTWDRDRGLPGSGRILLANRHNLWEASRDAEGKPLPVAQRQVRPLVYHLSGGFPRELLPAVRALEAGWDRAFRKAVAVPRGQRPEDVGQVFFVCETPVPTGAPAPCGAPGTAPRVGDLRFNVLAWVDRPQKAGPLGYGPVGTDPETGEIVQAGAYVYGAGLDAWVGEAQQVLDVMNGLTPLDALVAGREVRDYVRPPETAAPRASGPAPSAQGLVEAPAGTPLSPYARVGGALAAPLASFEASGGLPPRRADRHRAVDALVAQQPALAASLVDLPEVRAAVLSLAPGGAWRRKLEAEPALYRAVARQTLLRMGELQALQRRRADWASRHNIWLAEFSDDAFRALALGKKALYEARLAAYLQEGAPQEEARRRARADVTLELRLAALRSVAEHEVGHTVGLRHNFQGSYDALNYHDGYWRLRKDSLGVVAGGRRVMPLSPADLAAASERTRAQLEGGMDEYAYSSVMDYGARLNGAFHGLGRYDEAALLFGYAGGGELGWVEVFEETRKDPLTPHVLVPTTDPARPLRVRGAHVQMPFAQLAHRTPYSPHYTDLFHYSTLPFHFASEGLPFTEAVEQGVRRMQRRAWRPWRELAPRYAAMEAELQRLELGSVPWLDARFTDFDLARVVAAAGAAGGGAMPVEVPYMFCSDGEVGANVTCNRFDAGADLREVTRDWLSRYEGHYAFSHFKRDRLLFGVGGVLGRTYGSYLGNLPALYHHWLFNLFLAQRDTGATPEQLEAYLQGGDVLHQAYTTMAVFDGVNALLGSLSAVAPGYYGRLPAEAGGEGPERWVRLAHNAPDSARLPPAGEDALVQALTGPGGEGFTDVAYLPRGRGVRSPYTLAAPDGHDFYARVQEVGHFWDQYAALTALTQSTTAFLGVDRGADALRYSLPYYLAFPEELSRVIGAVWTEDLAVLAPALVRGEGRLAAVVPPAHARAERLLPGFVYPPLPAGGAAPAAARAESPPTWGTRYTAELFGMAFFTENFNQDFASQNQVFTLGAGDAVAPIPGFRTVSAADPFQGGFSHAALCRLSDPADPASACAAPLTPAATLVLRAASQTQAWRAAPPGEEAAAREGALRETVRSLELMRSLYGLFGRAL
jgi:hypothetical protein